MGPFADYYFDHYANLLFSYIFYLQNTVCIKKSWRVEYIAAEVWLNEKYANTSDVNTNIS